MTRFNYDFRELDSIKNNASKTVEIIMSYNNASRLVNETLGIIKKSNQSLHELMERVRYSRVYRLLELSPDSLE